MLNEPSPLTVKAVMKLNPDAGPTPPESCACQLPPAAACDELLLLPHPFASKVSIIRIAIFFISIIGCGMRLSFASAVIPS